MGIKRIILSFFVLVLLFYAGSYSSLKANNIVNANLVITQAEDQSQAPSDEISKKYGFNLVQELILGRTVAYGLLERFDNKLNTDEKLNNYVNLVGQSIAKVASKRPNVKYKFGIIDAREINAFACPGGYIFVTTGLLGILANENELAAVLAHEIGHVENGDGLRDIRTHKADEYAKADVDNLEKNIGAVNDVATSLPYAGWYASYYSPKNMAKRQIGNLIGNIGGGYGGYVASSVAGEATDVAVDAASQGLKGLAKVLAQKAIKRWYYDPLEPAIEFEADKYSVDALGKVGYDPKSMTSFLEVMKTIESSAPVTGGSSGSGNQNLFAYRHPPIEFRIDKVNTEINTPGFQVKNPDADKNPVLKSRFDGKVSVLK